MGAAKPPTCARRCFWARQNRRQVFGVRSMRYAGPTKGLRPVRGRAGVWRRPRSLRYRGMTVLLVVRSWAHPWSTTSTAGTGRGPAAAAHDDVRACSGAEMGERGRISSTSAGRATERSEGDTPTRGMCVDVREPEIWVTMLPTPLRGYGKASGLFRIYLGRSSNLVVAKL